MTTDFTESHFATPHRADERKIKDDFELVRKMPYVADILDSMPQVSLVLNKYRQIVYANKSFYDAFSVSSVDDLLGLRPGEAMECEYGLKADSGCGTARQCRYCKAVMVILKAIDGETSEEECCIIRKNDGMAIELRVKASPFNVAGENFVLINALDISTENRLKLLEKLFFHDILNMAGAIRGLSQLLPDIVSPDKAEANTILKSLGDGITELIDEVKAQKNLTDAFNGELVVNTVRVQTGKVVEVLCDVYVHYMEDKGCAVKPAEDISDMEIVTDKTLLIRVLGNLVKNGIEEVKVGEKVEIGCDETDKEVVFYVKNPGVMDDEVRNQIYKKTFTTKGQGRGMGAYAAKLITERYLKGRMDFVSDSEHGTIFYVWLPKSI